jgi:hypothetical protein
MSAMSGQCVRYRTFVCSEPDSRVRGCDFEVTELFAYGEFVGDHLEMMSERSRQRCGIALGLTASLIAGMADRHAPDQIGTLRRFSGIRKSHSVLGTDVPCSRNDQIVIRRATQQALQA